MMHALSINHIKTKKANTIKSRHQKQINTTNFIHFFEIILVVAVITRVSFQLSQQAFKFSYEYLQSLSHISVSPQFMFVLGNVIVITLFMSSGKFNNVPRTRTNHITYEHKKKMNSKKIQTQKQGKTGEFPVMEMMVPGLKDYRRSELNGSRKERIEMGCFEFSRSKMEMERMKGCDCDLVNGCCKETGECHYPEDHMSNEEFKKTIEEFIARKQRLLRLEEEFSALDSCLQQQFQ